MLSLQFEKVVLVPVRAPGSQTFVADCTSSEPAAWAEQAVQRLIDC